MASLVLGAVGAVVGSAFGMPALGWTIGSALGGALFPGSLPDQVGPRISDLKVQSSTYGNMIPIYYGVMRGSGNVIWSTDLAEHRTDTEQGGKGGPSQTTTTFSYSVSCAVSLCEGPIIGVRRIWADSTLIYEASAANIGKVQMEGLQFKVYLGDETQLPDPTIEADKGAGNVPGYRGQAYVVFTDFPLEKFGNRTPNFSFEVVTSGSFAGQHINYEDPQNLDSLIYNPLLNELWVTWDYDVLGITRVMVRYNADTMEINGYVNLPTYVSLYSPMQYDSFDQAVWAYTNTTIYKFSAETGALIFSAAQTAVPGPINPIDGGLWGVVSDKFRQIDKTDGTTITEYAYESKPISYWVWDGDGNIWFTTHANITERDGSKEDAKLKIFYPSSGTFNIRYDHGAILIAQLTYDSIRNAIWFNQGTTFWQLDLDIYPVVIANQVTWVGNYAWDVKYEKERDVLWIADWQANKIVGIYLSTGAIFRDISVSRPTIVIPFYQGNAIFISDYVTYLDARRINFDRLTPSAIALSVVVSDLSVRAGLTTGDINVAALTDMVDGYAITRQSPVRSPTEQLQQAYFFDAVESDDIVKFVKRGGASAVTISSDDLAAHAYGEQLPDIISTTRAQEVELPSALNVLYLNPLADYQTSTQQSKRLIGASGESMSVELPLVLSDDHAKQIADRSMFNAWTARTSHKFTTTNKYSKYEPTDVMTVDGKVLRIVKKDEAQGIIRWEAAAELAAIYTQAGTGVATPSNAQTIAAAGYTNLQLIDIPMLRDQDDDAGIYYAAAGYLAGWAGAILYKSTDDGATYSESGAITAAASIGAATTALANFTGGNVFDEANTLIVAMIGGATLSSTTEIAVLNGINAALIGSEIIQYKTATMNGDGTYTLSGLLRGRKGSEWAMSAHAAGDRFVALSTATLQRLAATSAEIGLERKYKGVTIGSTLAGTSAQNFTNTGVALECYAPVLLGGGRDASGNITINWVRRTRIGGEWRDYVDAPLGEVSESYDVEIWNSTYTTLKRTFSALSSATTPYSSAEQTTDFGGNQATIYVRVYQLSSAVGRGYKLEGTI